MQGTMSCYIFLDLGEDYLPALIQIFFIPHKIQIAHSHWSSLLMWFLSVHSLCSFSFCRHCPLSAWQWPWSWGLPTISSRGIFSLARWLPCLCQWRQHVPVTELEVLLTSLQSQQQCRPPLPGSPTTVWKWWLGINICLSLSSLDDSLNTEFISGSANQSQEEKHSCFPEVFTSWRGDNHSNHIATLIT